MFASATGLWCAALPLAAASAARPEPGAVAYLLTAGVYGLGALVCHQRPERSFYLWGAQLPVCARCVGIYVGAAGAGIAACWPRRIIERALLDRARLVVATAALPTVMTLLFEWTGGRAPANWVRAASGIPLGAAVLWVIVATSTSRPTVEIH